jgi:hypothetical protein
MSDLTPVKKNIQVEETQFRSAVSESTLQKVGSSVNFINDFQFDSKAFEANGPYNITGVNEIFVDGLYRFPYACTIFYVTMFNSVAGTGGTTSLDIKITNVSGSPGSFASIFSTAPTIDYTAGSGAFISTSGSGSGMVAPVISGGSYNASAGDVIRMDFLSKQTGAAQNCGIIICFKPR